MLLNFRMSYTPYLGHFLANGVAARLKRIFCYLIVEVGLVPVAIDVKISNSLLDRRVTFEVTNDEGGID
ncbi:unnamed protein product [Toxocara canis]|uniref:Uncharacterized protein n=1 Tax=Toxocara canis TaxID=6265 RepID=A0A183VHE9_TOXCA|nr:unnamed protein product [Toxocara canis]